MASGDKFADCGPHLDGDPIPLTVRSFNAVMFERGQRFRTFESGTPEFGRYHWARQD